VPSEIIGDRGFRVFTDRYDSSAPVWPARKSSLDISAVPTGSRTLKSEGIKMGKPDHEQSWHDLLNELQSIPPGAIGDGIRDKVLRLLKGCWDKLKGSDETSMEPWKVADRAEDLRWDPPILSFTIERHGAKVLGSGRGALHEWRVDVEQRAASCLQAGYRQLTPPSPRLNVKPIVGSICEAVQQGPKSGCALVQKGIVTWKGDHEVSIGHGDLISGNNKQTKAGRRKRFCNELVARMKTLGWDFVSGKRTMIFERSRA
jgi:hypothetical protein